MIFELFPVECSAFVPCFGCIPIPTWCPRPVMHTPWNLGDSRRKRNAIESIFVANSFLHLFGRCFVSLAVEHPKVGSSICTSDKLNTWAEQKKSGTLNLEMDSCRPHTNYGGSLLQPGRLRYMSTCFILFGTFNTVMNSLPSLQLEALDCAREEVVVHSLLLMY